LLSSLRAQEHAAHWFQQLVVAFCTEPGRGCRMPVTAAKEMDRIVCSRGLLSRQILGLTSHCRCAYRALNGPQQSTAGCISTTGTVNRFNYYFIICSTGCNRPHLSMPASATPKVPTWRRGAGTVAAARCINLFALLWSPDALKPSFAGA
jgi:hypothetical protein